MSGHNAPEQMADADFQIDDPGDGKNIASPQRWGGVVNLVSGASGETRTLSDPEKAGLQITLGFQTDGGGDVAVTAATGINQTGNTVMTLADAGDEITLRSIKKGTAYVWRIASNDGVALS